MSEWTPIITSSAFDGIRADVLVAAGGILTLMLIVLGVAVLARAFGH